ncbi:alpha-galactosidase [Candidatus Sumerlaeota bacterium]|nr:alpha-galactosidase [Candidatus Sumerlaeota bacterium]
MIKGSVFNQFMLMYIFNLLLVSINAFPLEDDASLKNIYSLSTEDTMMRVGIKNNAPALFQMNSTGNKWNWASRPREISLMNHVYIRGERKSIKWEFKDALLEEKNGTKLALNFKAAHPPLELSSIWKAYPGPGPIEHEILIRNLSTEEIQIPIQKTIDFQLLLPIRHQIECWWVEKGNGTPSLIGTHKEIIYDGYYFYKPSTPYCLAPGADMIPWITIQDRKALHGFYMGIESSGQVCINISANGTPLILDVKSGIDDTYVEYRSRIPPQGSYETPACFIGCFKGDVDDGANRLHRFVETRLRPPVHDARYPLLVNNSWGSGMAVDDTLARKMIDDAAALGIEIFHLDAGWYKGVGEWRPHPDKFPKGLVPIVDYAHQKGMLFGLWVGWAQGGNPPNGMSKLAVSNPDMKNWFPRDLPEQWRPEDFTGETVCLACDQAKSWCLEELRRIVKEYKIDLLEHDQRVAVEVCPRSNHRHLDNPADISHHATNGYYEIYDRLRKEFPRLIFENCVNGGRMVDFGVAKRVHYICFTDTYNPLSNRRGFYDASFPLPPSMCEAYVAHHPGPTLDTFKAMLRSGMMGWCAIMCDTSSWTMEQKAAAKRQFEIYKTWIRPLINKGNLYHIEKRPDGVRWDGMQYYDPQTGKGIVFAFRATTSRKDHIYKLKGLLTTEEYQIRYEDGTSTSSLQTGDHLMNYGLFVRLEEPETSELIYIEKR